MAQLPETETKQEEEKDDKQGCPEKVEFKYADKEKERWSSLHNLLGRPSSKFAPPPFDAEEDNLAVLQEDFRVLVVGAGGLGCEILKNLALSGFKDIEVIDLDIIDLSNLNRQFLFRKKDIGQPKAKVAAEFVMKRVPGCTIKWYQKPLQEFSKAFYSKFNVVIAGLDNVEARRWLNAMLCDLVSTDDDGNIDIDSIIPLIDGGTEGFLGQCRLFVPMLSSCFECSLGLQSKRQGYAPCTVANIPRLPEHCIYYAHKMLWPRLVSLHSASDYVMIPMEKKHIADAHGVQLDKDNVEHMSWIFHRAVERAEKFKIEGVTFTLTMQVVKNIIPAVASTNALISACCVNEAFKILTWCSYGLNNYMMYLGQDGIYSRTFNYKKNPYCIACGSQALPWWIDAEQTLAAFYRRLVEDKTLKLQTPSIATERGSVLFLNNEALRELYQENMQKKMRDLVENDTILQVTDPAVLGKMVLKIKVKFA